MESKKVVMLINRLEVGGAQRLVIEDIKEFVHRGWEVHLVTFNPEKEYTLVSLLPIGFAPEIIHFKGVYDFKAILQLAQYFKTFDPDIIISHMWYANFFTRIAARIAGFQNRTISFEQNLSYELKTWKQLWVDYFLQRWCRFVIAVCPEVRDSLVRSGIDTRRIKIILMALDAGPIVRASPSDIRKELNLKDTFIYLSAGRLTTQKAIDVLLDAFAKVRGGVLLLAGQGEERKNLERQGISLGIQNRVFFLGVRNDIPGLMKVANCFVFPSRWEPFGMVMLEAMAAGAPLIVSDFPTAHDVVHDGESALIVPRENSSALADAMQRIQDEAALGQRLAAEASQRVKKFSPQVHVNAILEVFR